MSAGILVFDPVAPHQDKPANPIHRLDKLAGKVVGFIDNAKPNFDHLVDELEALLMAKHGVSRVVKRRKRGPSIAAPDSMLQELSEQCDAVIVGSGD